MIENVYFDTNIIVDLFDESRISHKYSLKVINTFLQNKEIELFINSDSMTNLFYILRHHVKFDLETSLEKLESIKDIFTISSIVKEDCEAAIKICKEKKFDDYEDALQYICAVKEECLLFVTNNIKDFKNSSIETKTTKELVEILKL